MVSSILAGSATGFATYSDAYALENTSRCSLSSPIMCAIIFAESQGSPAPVNV